MRGRNSHAFDTQIMTARTNPRHGNITCCNSCAMLEVKKNGYENIIREFSDKDMTLKSNRLHGCANLPRYKFVTAKTVQFTERFVARCNVE